MCGRYVSPDEAAIERAWNLTRAPNPFRTLYNAAPTLALPVIRRHRGGIELQAMRWGLIPFWWSNAKLPHATINARVEEVAEKPMWRAAAERSRCLVPSLGWYEWKEQGSGRGRQPFFIHLPQGELFHFAGLWSSWKPKGGEPLLSFAILTCEAAGGIASIHDRMPLALAPSAYDAWLDPALNDAAAAMSVAAGAAMAEFEAYAVSTYVNSPRNEGEECVRPVSEDGKVPE